MFSSILDQGGYHQENPSIRENVIEQFEFKRKEKETTSTSRTFTGTNCTLRVKIANHLPTGTRGKNWLGEISYIPKDLIDHETPLSKFEKIHAKYLLKNDKVLIKNDKS